LATGVPGSLSLLLFDDDEVNVVAAVFDGEDTDDEIGVDGFGGGGV
jgi:hypothetical protein